MLKKTVLLRAPLMTSSGYGVHSRQVFRWLLTHDNIDLYTQPLPWGSTSWLINPELENGLVGKAMEYSRPPPSVCDVTFQVQLPNEWDHRLGRFNVGVTAAVETDICNGEWVDACNRMSCVVVPSEHIASVLRASGKLTCKLQVIPEAFFDEIVTSGIDVSTSSLDFGTKFNFLLVGQFTGNNPYNDRKNLFFTIKWLCETFQDDNDVGVVLKLNSGRGSKIDRDVTHATIKKLLGEVRKTTCPKIHVVHGCLTNAEIAGLYKNPSIRALVSLTRGEGFGLPLLEAAASGLPVIATNWSGHLDFLNHGKFIKIDYDLKPIHTSRIDEKIFVKNSRWAEPREDDFKRKVNKFRTKSEPVKEWAIDLQKTIIERYSQGMINSTYDSVFGQII